MKVSSALFSCSFVFFLTASASFPEDLPLTASPAPEVTVDGAGQPLTSLKQLPLYILQDQGALWKSPFQMKRENAKWWLLFGGVTGGLIAGDHWSSRQLSNSAGQVSLGKKLSHLGAGYTLYPASFGMYLLGNRTGNNRLAETGLLGLEALANGYIMDTALKVLFSRQRPSAGAGNGNFFSGGGIGSANSSFPSGHAVESWALASIIAHEYPHPRYIPVLAYGGATSVLLGRFLAQKHFSSDLVLGAGIGWFIGHFVYTRHRDPELETSKFKRFLADHVDLGQ